MRTASSIATVHVPKEELQMNKSLGSLWRALLAGALLVPVLPGVAVHALAQDVQVRSLSTPSHMVSGGDALIRVEVPGSVPLANVVVKRNGQNVTSLFRADQAARTLTGLVTGLMSGPNAIEAFTNAAGQGRPADQLTITNFPITGPVFSGPQEQPFICATQSFNLPAGLGNLGAPLDANCSISRRVDYIYRTTTGSYAQLPPGATSYPANMAMTTTTLGQSVPFIVRMETGTVNRAIYQTTVLHDPIAQPMPNWFTPPANWNNRLIYTFGGGCINGWYRQGSSTGGVTDAFMLGKGYALASSSLNVFGNNCNDLPAAETMMMVRERFIEAYGPPVHTQGWGCSGGSYAQHQITDNYPGLLDGIIPGCSFPEVGFATINFITDSWLLDNYFNTRAGVAWTPEQKRQVTGFMVYNTAPNVAVGARRIDPRGDINRNCGTLPPALKYDPVSNPGGARCDVYDHTVNTYGRDPVTGFARRPLDNVGIQYGLGALNDRVITVDQFLDLNEKVGGFDRDANILPPGNRSMADLVAARAAYRTGRLTNTGGGLSAVPIIDYRAYNDEVPGGDIHVRYHSFSLRERLEKANGRADNQVMVVEDNRYGLYSNESPLLQRMILQMDQWITAIKADTRDIPQIEKVVQNKPAALQEGCNTRDANPTFIAEHQVRDPATVCEQLYPSNSFPREVAGANVAADIIKCQLKPITPADYAVTFTAEQMARLQAIFPNGVCDWSRPGVEQQPLAGTWLAVASPGQIALTACVDDTPNPGSCIPDVTVSIVPDVLNLRTAGGVVMAVITLAEGSDLGGWSVSNVMLAGAPALSTALSSDGRAIVASFRKRDLATLPTGNAVSAIVTGTLQKNGQQGQFTAATSVRVIR
jgi:hypothetical protein